MPEAGAGASLSAGRRHCWQPHISSLNYSKYLQMYFAEGFFLLWLKAQHIALEELQMFVNKVRGSLKSKQTVTCGHPNSRVLAREIQNIDTAAL